MFRPLGFEGKANGIIAAKCGEPPEKMPRKVLYDALFYGPQACQPGNMARQLKATLVEAIQRGVLSERNGQSLLVTLNEQWQKHIAAKA